MFGGTRRLRAGMFSSTAVVVCALALSAVAVATAPLKGRSYRGTVGKGHGSGSVSSGGGLVEFRVSARGTSISDFHAPAEIPCSGAAGFNPPSTAKVKKGGFTISFSQGLVSVVYRGRFLSHGRARGTIVFKVTNPISSKPCTAVYPWSAKALRAGSAICPDHMGPGASASDAADIVAVHISCHGVDKALDAGRYTPAGKFTTAGWKCTGTAHYSCSRRKPKASFAFTQDGIPCGAPGLPPGPQCMTKTAADRRVRV
jgi:hypothetical protein